MVEDKILRSRILLEALPYIKKFYGKFMVVKCGGKILEEEGLKEALAKDLVLLKFVGIKPVLVHGGGVQVSRLLEKLGKRSQFQKGIRQTDEETLEVVEMVLGKVNKDLVNMIHRMGGKAVGVSGKDGHSIIASQKEEYGLVGEILRVDTALIEILEREGYIPVVSPVGVDEEGKPLNINADEVAGEISRSLGAIKLILITDTPGILADPSRPDSLIPTLDTEEVRKLIQDRVIDGGMIPKVKAGLRSLEGGVEKVHIINGLLPHSLLLEIFTDRGIGTEMVKRRG